MHGSHAWIQETMCHLWIWLWRNESHLREHLGHNSLLNLCTCSMCMNDPSGQNHIDAYTCTLKSFVVMILKKKSRELASYALWEFGCMGQLVCASLTRVLTKVHSILFSQHMHKCLRKWKILELHWRWFCYSWYWERITLRTKLNVESL